VGALAAGHGGSAAAAVSMTLQPLPRRRLDYTAIKWTVFMRPGGAGAPTCSHVCI